MPNFSLSKLTTGIAVVLLAFGLAACSNQAETPVTSQIILSSPLSTSDAEWQNISGFDVYAEGSRLHAVFTATSSDPKHPLIAYLHSEDGGLHWSLPQELSKQFTQAVESKIGNDIQIVAWQQRLMIVWQTTGEIPGMGPLTAIFSTDAGERWQSGVNPVASDNDQSHPELVADTLGQFHMVWLDDRDENGYQGLRYARTADAGQNWQAAQTIDESSCSCCWNRMAITDNQAINVLYRDMQPRDMALAQSTDAGDSWQRISTVGDFNWRFDGCPHNGGGLSVYGNTLHSLIWTGVEQQVGLYYLRSLDAGTTWSQPQPIAANTGAFHSDIAARDDKKVAVIWDAAGANGSQVFFSVSADNGEHWSAPQLLSTGNVAANPRLFATSKGWLALWTEQQAQGQRLWLSAVIF